MKSWIQIHSKDNVIIALQPLAAGERLQLSGQRTLTVAQDIAKGHKIAIEQLTIGDHLIKYGESIGHATAPVAPGDWVHTHNTRTNLSDKTQYSYQPAALAELAAHSARDVNIYRRDNGAVAIRNELWVIPTVGCVNGLAKQVAAEFQAEHCRDGQIHGIDGVHVFPHQFGCSQLGDDHVQTQKLLQAMVQHPNAGGVLVIGLGCENNQISEFKAGLPGIDPQRVRFMVAQAAEDEISEGVQHLAEIYQAMRADQREPGKLHEVTFGLECGGSDGLSGITANPLLGQLSDTLISQGGTTVLTEVPEMFGAETLLMERARNQGVFDQIVTMVDDFKDYYLKHGLPVYENPSPGNKAGGITTLEDKSLGCTQKAGQSQVNAVVDYAERIESRGLNLLNAPGNDAIATSALAAAGCHMVLFTTGRGTPYGGFVPTLKIATNSELAARKTRWIDFDAGQLVSSDISMSGLLDQLQDELVAVVNGKPTCNERNDIRELAIWKNGVTL